MCLYKLTKPSIPSLELLTPIYTELSKPTHAIIKPSYLEPKITLSLRLILISMNPINKTKVKNHIKDELFDAI